MAMFRRFVPVAPQPSWKRESFHAAYPAHERPRRTIIGLCRENLGDSAYKPGGGYLLSVFANVRVRLRMIAPLRRRRW